MRRIGFDREGREIARIEMKDATTGGHVVYSDLINGEWHVAIDANDGGIHEARHEFRMGAIYLALGKLLGIDAVITRWYPEASE